MMSHRQIYIVENCFLYLSFKILNLNLEKLSPRIVIRKIYKKKKLKKKKKKKVKNTPRKSVF
jgi:hypothetical protein